MGAQEIQHVAYRDIYEHHLLGLSSDRTHFAQEHHHEDNDADDVCFYIKSSISKYHTAIIASHYGGICYRQVNIV